MSEGRVERRLAAVLAADVAGYSRLMEADEEGTLSALRAIRRELGDPKIAEHRGRIVKTTGDGLLAEFASVIDAVRYAVAVQRAMAERNTDIPRAERIEFRIGIHQGDIIAEVGDGVNLAARLESLADPGGICVSGRVHADVAGKIDVAFEDLGERRVKNISRPLRVFRAQLGAPKAAAAKTPPALAVPDKPSLAVLPFQNMSGDPEQEYFADGMVEEITTAIQRLPWLFVIARNSSFTYKGRTVDVKQIARELGVRYVLEGSVRKAGNRVRITGQLIDTTTGARIWADRFDGALDDIFELQDRFAGNVVAAIEPRLRLAEIERATRKPTESLDAYDLYLRALAEFHKLTLEGYRACVALLRRGLEIDPAYAPAAGLVGWCRLRQCNMGAVTQEEIGEGVGLARRVIAAGKDDPDALWMAGFTVAGLAQEPAMGLSAIERSLALNPNSALGWCVAGWVHAFLNRPEPAIEPLERAMRLSPLDPLGYLFTAGLAYAHFAAKRYDTAMEWVDRSLGEQTGFPPAAYLKVALCGHLGRVEEGQRWVRRVPELYPGQTVATLAAFADAFMSADLRSDYIEGLRLAGLPEK
jgi:adenylate cyclase